VEGEDFGEWQTGRVTTRVQRATDNS
jgi:hypothetical protein